MKDASHVLFNLAVNTHVDDLENAGEESWKLWLKQELTKLYGALKEESEDWQHTGSDMNQDSNRKRLVMRMRKYCQQLADNRGLVVVKTLVEKFGVPPSLLSSRGVPGGGSHVLLFPDPNVRRDAGARQVW